MKFSNIIFLICIILFILIVLKKKIEIFDSKKYKIAVYTYNFGNFRGELNKDIDNFVKHENLDYFLYTDQENITSKKWKVIKVPLRKRTEHMNANRVTTKYYKFKYIPKEIKNYDYILHIDSSRLHYLNDFSYSKLNKIISNNINYNFIGRKHPRLKDIYQECQAVKRKYDSPFFVDRFKKKLLTEKFSQRMDHLELCFFLRNIQDEKLNKILSEVYDEIMINKLCRDQLVFIYIMQKNNYANLKWIPEFSRHKFKKLINN